ncbi:MAG: hypothetical protein H7Z42_09515 [Roseiflexaceae bacterium]|nr:hypothetical protein [Roseiflexaceae bacterium]
METLPLTELLPVLLAYLGPQVPLYVVWVVGIVLAFGRRGERPRAARLAIVAFATFLASSLFFGCLQSYLVFSLPRGGLEPQQYGLIFGVVGLAATLLHTAGWVVLLLALFGREPERTSVE